MLQERWELQQFLLAMSRQLLCILNLQGVKGLVSASGSPKTTQNALTLHLSGLRSFTYSKAGLPTVTAKARVHLNAFISTSLLHYALVHGLLSVVQDQWNSSETPKNLGCYVNGFRKRHKLQLWEKNEKYRLVHVAFNVLIYKGFADSSSLPVLSLLSLTFSSFSKPAGGSYWRFLPVKGSFSLPLLFFGRSKAPGSFKATKRHLWLEEALKINWIDPGPLHRCLHRCLHSMS